MVTASDVARLAGVSQSTVSYVMSGTRSISPATRAKVEAAMKKLGYHPNAGARALAGRRTNVIGLAAELSPNMDVSALLPFIDTISSQCRERDYDVVLLTADEGPEGLERLAGRAIVDGIVLMDVRPQDPRVQTARDLPVPVVLIGVPDDAQGLDCVDFDVASAGRLAAQELIDTGHDRVFLIGESPQTRAQGFGFIQTFADSVRDTAVAAGVDFEIYEPDAEGWGGFAGLWNCLGLSSPERLTGIVARTPQTLDMAMQILVSHGATPGQAVSIVGLCPDDTAMGFQYPVSNVSPEPRDVSRRAMRRLFERIGGACTTEPDVTLIPPRLTRRSTTVIAHP